MNLQHFYQLAKKSVVAWIDDYAPSMGAAISYYTVFSIAPLMIIVIAVAGFVWGREAVQGEIVGQLSGLIGQEGAQGIQALIESANQPTKGLVATAISIVVLVIGATTVFAELQSALDRIWRAPKAPQVSGIWAIVRSRLLSLGFILGLGFLLLVSLVSGAALAAFGSWIGRLLPGWENLLFVINIVFSIGIATVLFAMIFKVMPQVKVGWRDVWTGAFVTAVLFEVGKWLISLYIGKSSITSSFAAAGSLVVLLVWVYYSAQIFLLGAEFTWVFANEHGSLAGKKKPGTAALPAEPSGTARRQDRHGQPAAKLPDLPLQSDLVIIGPFSSRSAPVPSEASPKAPRHVSLKQRAIVYAGSAAAYLALRLLIKRKGKGRVGMAEVLTGKSGAQR